MDKFKIRFYQKSNSMWFVNGGTFIITEEEYIIKYLFQTVARFDINNTVASKPAIMSNGIHLTDGKKSIDIYFFSKTAQKVYRLLNLK